MPVGKTHWEVREFSTGTIVNKHVQFNSHLDGSRSKFIVQKGLNPHDVWEKLK